MITHKGHKPYIRKGLYYESLPLTMLRRCLIIWANDERVTRYLTWSPHESPEATKQFLELWCAAYKNPNTYNWVVEYEGTPIGGINVVRLSEKSEYAELGYCIGHAYWNKGFVSEAAKAVIAYLFAEIGVNRVGISHAVKNPASGRVAQKCGLTLEGAKREYFKTSTGKFLDMSDYGIIRSEWKSMRRENNCM